MLGFRHIQMIPLGDFDGRQLSVLDAAIDGRSVARFLFILPHFGVRFRRSLPFISISGSVWRCSRVLRSVRIPLKQSVNTIMFVEGAWTYFSAQRLFHGIGEPQDPDT